MRLYHFTSAQAVFGADALEKFQAHERETINVFDLAAPGSILDAGLKPVKNDDYAWAFPKPLPACAWLTSDPNMPPEFCSTNSAWRVEVELDRCDSRLRRWDDYINENCPTPHVFEYAIADEAHKHGMTAQDAIDAKAKFFVYFGTIPPRRLRSVSASGEPLPVAA